MQPSSFSVRGCHASFADLAFVLIQFHNFYFNSIELNCWTDLLRRASSANSKLLLLIFQNKRPFIATRAFHSDAAGLRLQKRSGCAVTSCSHFCFTFSWMGQRQCAGAHGLCLDAHRGCGGRRENSDGWVTAEFSCGFGFFLFVCLFAFLSFVCFLFFWKRCNRSVEDTIGPLVLFMAHLNGLKSCRVPHANG